MVNAAYFDKLCGPADLILNLRYPSPFTEDQDKVEIRQAEGSHTLPRQISAQSVAYILLYITI